ncbi:hypothetical protein BDV41DRAFT_304142 [Aspergillus transmontanensis]|uniref:Secreted protein n=1 Tax=Aspergillus transmontanensis TaxID=1034304 RepID=A0A5N6VUP4_9EURO|nr:hypothetical protein BDV41DRAFT_304142 [Aspergillus transmontanensis]
MKMRMVVDCVFLLCSCGVCCMGYVISDIQGCNVLYLYTTIPPKEEKVPSTNTVWRRIVIYVEKALKS